MMNWTNAASHTYVALQKAAERLRYQLQALGRQSGERVAMPLSMLVNAEAQVFRGHDRKAVFALADESAILARQMVPSECPTLSTLAAVCGAAALKANAILILIL